MRRFLSNNLGVSFQSILLMVFIFTCMLRGQYIGELSNRQHVWLTASSVKFTDIWVNEGALKSDFLLIEEPASILQPKIEDREIYASQPSGSILPIFILKKIFPNIDTLLIIHIYSLFNLFLIALSAYWVVVTLLGKKLKGVLSHVYGLMAGSSYLLMPAPLYWHSIIYFTDIAVILPFSIIILVEVKIRVLEDSKGLNYLLFLQSIAIFIMAAIEYFSIPAATSIFFFRIIFFINTGSRCL